MKNKICMLLLATALTVTGCYLPINGRVLDAQTNKPIEGAVVLVEWTKTIGYGLTRTESYKVAETISDKDGKFDLPGCYSPFVNVPDLTIYKKGYVAWSSKLIFPRLEIRDSDAWKHNSVYKLDLFRKDYSYIKHQSFIDIAASLSSANSQKKLFINAYEDGEEKEILLERNSR